MWEEINILGKKYGRLLVVARVGSNKNNKIVWKCECDCGEIIDVIGSALRTGHTLSCGCFNREKSAEYQTKHGLADHPLYRSWIDIKKRCYNENHKCYRWYGAKGVKLCREWFDSVQEFVSWGLKNGWEDGLSIDRIDSNGDYEPNNCQFLTKSDNTLKMIEEHYR